MFAKLRLKGCGTCLVDPAQVSYLVGEGEAVDDGDEWTAIGMGGQELLLADTVPEVEAALAQARRVKFTRENGRIIRIAPEWVKAVEWAPEGRGATMLHIGYGGSVWAALETEAEVLAALGWAQ